MPSARTAPSALASNVAAPARPTSRRGALATLCSAMLLSSLGTSIANVALPALADAFDASFGEVQWVVIAYLVAVTASIVAAGRLADIVGRRRMLLAGLLVFTAASALCGMAPSLPLLVAARALQGLGAAVMMALALALAGEAVPKTSMGSAMGLLGTMSAIGTALGPTLGGALVAGLGWPAIFLVNVPLGATAFLLARRQLPREERTTPAKEARFDGAGMLLLMLTLGAYALAMTTGSGGFGRLEMALLAAAVPGFGLFVLVEAKAASPLIRLSMFRNAALSAGLAQNAIVSSVMMATLVIGPFHLVRSLGLDAGAAGLAMAAGPLVAAVAGVPAGRLADRMGARRTGMAGLAVMGVGASLLSLMPAAAGVSGYVLPLAILTGGYALFQSANNASLMKDADADMRGLVSGMLSLSRNLGLVTGASAMGAVFALASGAPDIAGADPLSVARGMRVTFAFAAVMIAAALAIAAASHRQSSVRRSRNEPPGTEPGTPPVLSQGRRSG